MLQEIINRTTLDMDTFLLFVYLKTNPFQLFFGLYKRKNNEEWLNMRSEILGYWNIIKETHHCDIPELEKYDFMKFLYNFSKQLGIPKSDFNVTTNDVKTYHNMIPFIFSQLDWANIYTEILGLERNLIKSATKM